MKNSRFKATRVCLTIPRRNIENEEDMEENIEDEYKEKPSPIIPESEIDEGPLIHYLFPNYEIDGVTKNINLDKIRPERSIEEPILKVNTEHNKSVRRNKEELNKCSKGVGQIVIIWTGIPNINNEYANVVTATFSVIKYKNELLILTTHHTYIYEEAEHMWGWKPYIFLSFQHRDFSFLTAHIYQFLNPYFEAICQGKSPWVKKFEKEFGLERTTPIKSGYIYRNKYIERNIGLADRNIYFEDPIFQMQPMPSLDIGFLHFPNNYLNLISDGYIQPFDLDYIDIDSDIKTILCKDEFIGIIGYNFVALTIERYPHDNEYVNTNIGKFLAERAMNKGLSFSVGSILALGPILVFLSSNNEGSSGAPIVDSKGHLIAISFGNYCDHETIPQFHTNSKIHNSIKSPYYDRLLPTENTSTYTKGSKNYNLGFAVEQEGFREILYGAYREVKQKSYRLAHSRKLLPLKRKLGEIARSNRSHYDDTHTLIRIKLSDLN